MLAPGVSIARGVLMEFIITFLFDFYHLRDACG